MSRAYILIETTPGAILDAVVMLRELDEIEVVDTLTGPHDIVAVVDAIGMESLGDLLAEKIATIPGVAKTTTCIVVPG